MTDLLQKKIDRAIKLLKAAEKKASKVGQPVEVCYSGGKDSDVILELAKMSGINYRAIYKNTTIDPPGTIKHCRENGVDIVRPKTTFFQLIEKKGWPSRYVRFCCSELKEYKILDYAVLGIRANESKKRSERYKEPEYCREFSKTDKTKNVRYYLPLLDWSKKDLIEFAEERGIKFHPLYYDNNGVFHPERRLGCLCCPLSSRKHRIEEFKKYPNFVRFYIRGGKDRYENTMVKNKQYFKDVYEWFVCYLFCNSINEFRERFGRNLFDDGINCKELLEDYFNIKL